MIQKATFSSLSAPDLDFKFQAMKSTFYDLGLDVYEGLKPQDHQLRKQKSRVRILKIEKFKRIEGITLTMSMQATAQMLSAAVGFYLD